MYWWTSVYRGTPEKVRTFIRNGIDLQQRHTRNQMALHVVCDGGCTWGHIQVLNMLLDHGADVHALDDLENTPLHYAALKGHKAMASILLKRGAGLLSNKHGDTPLSLSKYNQRHNVNKLGHQNTYLFLLSWNNVQHWRAFVKRKKRRREQRYIWLVWVRHEISCDIRYLMRWL